MRLRRVGMREAFIALMQESGEEVDEEEVDWVVANRTTAGAAVSVPPIGTANPQEIERGRALYEQQTCDSCHGRDGIGVADLRLYDDRCRPTRARDLVHEPFTGGHDPRALYCRILLGMPGTPHPASKNLSDRELTDLVHYCQSLAKEPKRRLTNYQRARQATGSAYLAALRNLAAP